MMIESGGKVELTQLRALLALQELASLTRAGERLHLSPSAVFCQIRLLEDETGIKLYERVGRKLILTNGGEVLAQHARKLLSAHDTALLAIKEQCGTQKEVLRIGCGPHGSVRIVPFLLRAFVASHPNSEIRLVSSDDQSLLRDVRSGLLDAILMTLPVDDKELTEEVLWSYEMVFAVPPASRMPKRNVKFSDLRDLPFIQYRRAVVIDSALSRFWVELGFSPNVVMENDEVDSIKELVKLGFGITLLPLWSVAEEAKRGLLRIVRPPQQPLYRYGLLYRNSEYSPRILSSLREVAHQWQDWWPHAEYVVAPRR